MEGVAGGRESVDSMMLPVEGGIVTCATSGAFAARVLGSDAVTAIDLKFVVGARSCSPRTTVEFDEEEGGCVAFLVERGDRSARDARFVTVGVSQALGAV